MLSVSHSLRCTVYNIKIICQSGYQVLAASCQNQIEQNLQRQKGVAIFYLVWGAFELEALGSTENAILLCPQYDALLNKHIKYVQMGGKLHTGTTITISRNQCCGSGSGIRYLFDPWIRDPE
jgi:hypothetical protein